MNSIQEEPFSEDQWDQFIKEYEEEPQAFFTSEKIDTSLNSFTNTDYLVTPSAGNDRNDSNLGQSWAYQNTSHQSPKTQADNISNINFDQNSTAYKELKTLYVQQLLFKRL